MNPEAASSLVASTLFLVLKIGAPMLAAGLVVGLAVGLLQAATQVNEMTLTFTTKLVAVGAAFLVALPWAISELMTFTRGIMVLVADGPG